MKKHQSPYAFSLILLSILFFMSFAQASNESSSKEIESKIVEQLGDQFELKRWDIVDVEKIAKGPATIEKSTIKIAAITKEALYQPAGRDENGVRTLRLSKAAGDPIEFQGYLIKAIIPGMVQQPPVQVVVASGRSHGQPSSQFPSQEQRAALKTQGHQPASPAEPETPQAPSPNKVAPKRQENFAKLMAVYNEAGEVWGINTSRQQDGMPVILRNLKLTNGKALEGTIHHPFRELVNPFTMQSIDGMISLQVMAATPADRGARRDTLSCRAEGAELVGRSIRASRSGIRFALSTEQNLKLKKHFEKKLDPLKAAGNLKDCFYVGGKIFNVDTLAEASSSWVKSSSAIRVKNVSNRFLSADMGYGLTLRPFGAFPALYVKTVEPKGRMPIEPLRAYKDKAWVSDDLSEYVTLRDGDVWHGNMDWLDNSVKQERNVTNLGILNNLEPIAWYKNDFYFYNQHGADKPILRIDVKTGEIDEMEQTKALQRHSLGSPNGRFIFFSDGRGKYLSSGIESFVHVYDCKTRQTFTMDATIDERKFIGKMKEYPQPKKIEPRQWLSDGLFITNIGWYDLEKRERTLFIEKQGIIRDRPEHFYRVTSFNFLPAPDFVDITVQSYIRKEKKEFYRRYLVNRTTQVAIELPMELNKHENNNSNITWIDENRYVFSKKKGSLKDIGTWLFDVRTKTHRRLTLLFSNEPVNADNYCMKSEQKGCWPFPFYFYNQHLVFADKERIVFGVKKGNTSKLVSAPLNEGDIVEIALGARHQRMRRVLPFSIELPIGN